MLNPFFKEARTWAVHNWTIAALYWSLVYAHIRLPVLEMIIYHQEQTGKKKLPVNLMSSGPNLTCQSETVTSLSINESLINIGC